jgi:UDP-N-acetylglucosamine 2-epimerase
MSFIVDTFSAHKFLPVHVTHDGMELIETTLQVSKINNTIFVEIGEDKASTPAKIVSLLDDISPELLEQAIEEDCEYISFYI